MDEDVGNCVAVHCKGGKGRTGVMVASWLLYSRWGGGGGGFASASSALELMRKFEQFFRMNLCMGRAFVRSLCAFCDCMIVWLCVRAGVRACGRACVRACRFSTTVVDALQWFAMARTGESAKAAQGVSTASHTRARAHTNTHTLRHAQT